MGIFVAHIPVAPSKHVRVVLRPSTPTISLHHTAIHSELINNLHSASMSLVHLIREWALKSCACGLKIVLFVTGLVRSSFMDRASFLGEGGPARRKQLEGVLSSGLYGVVQARALLLDSVSL